MKTKTLFGAMLMMSMLIGCSQANSDKEKTGYLLWKISGKDLKKPSYLLGTLHLEAGTYIDSIPGARKALNDCEQVIGEVESSNPMEMQAQVQEYMKMPEDTSYRMLYADEDYELVDEGLKSTLGVGLEQLGMFKPSALSAMYAVALCHKILPGVNPINTIDFTVQQEAVKNDKPVEGLETAEFQANLLFNSDNLAHQAENLLCNLKNQEYGIAMMRTLVDDYHKANLDGLYEKYTNDKDNPCPASQEEINAMVNQRNEDWVQKLPEMIKEKSSFIAVGAMHLAGETGLLSKLEKEGYTVQAVKK
ncbi:MAG: TraB/GumN family protein [Prevotellaceae bacterium]|jgi:uncharacterized protein YbaP (TraB family)|nr:TraB/GumN family protein [Prevotellaceae bacterium]